MTDAQKIEAFANRVCPNCLYRVGMCYDANGDVVVPKPGTVMFCVACCQSLEITGDYNVRKLPPHILAAMLSIRTDEMVSMIRATFAA